MQKISAVIIAKNEEETLKECLESVKWVDEIIVIDDESRDKTVEIAKKFTKKIFPHKSAGYVEPARNFAVDKATGEWILFIDADERISPTLAKILQEIAKKNDTDVVLIPRKNIIFNKWIEYTGWWPDYQIRFFKKGKVVWKNKIHSQPEILGNKLKLSAEEQYAIVHFNFQSVAQFIQKNYLIYAKHEAEAKISQGYVFAWQDVLKFPANEFFSRYFAREGYKDGLHGLALSLLMAGYHLFVFLYLWEANNFPAKGITMPEIHNEMKQVGKDTKYWLNQERMINAKNPLKKSWQKFFK